MTTRPRPLRRPTPSTSLSKEACVSLGFLTAERFDEVFTPKERWSERAIERKKRTMDVNQIPQAARGTAGEISKWWPAGTSVIRTTCPSVYPGVAEPCREIAKDYEVPTLTRRSNLVAADHRRSAVLGLGTSVRPPVYAGDGGQVRPLQRSSAAVDAFPLCVDTKDVDKLVETIALISKSFPAASTWRTSPPPLLRGGAPPEGWRHPRVRRRPAPPSWPPPCSTPCGDRQARWGR